MNAHIDLPGPKAYNLGAAVLIYYESNTGSYYHGKGASLATRHKVTGGCIGTGVPVSAKDIRELFEGSDPITPSVASRPSLGELQWHTFPVLAASPEFYVWWTPPCHHSVFISGQGKKTKPTQAWFPGMVWRGTRHGHPRLRVAAVAGDKPPLPSDVAYALAMSNVYATGGVCIGSMKPSSFTPRGWVESFMEAGFSGDKIGLGAKPYDPTTLKPLGSVEQVTSNDPKQ